MQAGYPSRFPLGEEPASYVFHHDPLIVHDFIGMLRLPRDGRDKYYCMHSFVLAGVETIKKLLVPQSGSMGRFHCLLRRQPLYLAALLKPILRLFWMIILKELRFTSTRRLYWGYLSAYPWTQRPRRHLLCSSWKEGRCRKVLSIHKGLGVVRRWWSGYIYETRCPGTSRD